MTITISTWVIPLLITLALLGWAAFADHGGGYLSGAVEGFAAVFGILVTWLIWLILRLWGLA